MRVCKCDGGELWRCGEVRLAVTDWRCGICLNAVWNRSPVCFDHLLGQKDKGVG